MASIFAHLLDTYPFQAAIKSAARDSGHDEDDVPVSALSPYIWVENTTGPHASPSVPVPSILDLQIGARRIWEWKHDAGTPNVVTDIHCRVRDTGYKKHGALLRAEWGHVTGSGKQCGDFQPSIGAVLDNGTEVALPLDNAHLHSRWIVTGGYLFEDESRMFPLKAYLDFSLVLAFAYEITDGGVKVYEPPEGDPFEAALEEYKSASSGGCPDSAGDRWVARALKGDFMATGDGKSQGGVGETKKISANAERILVALTFVTTRERADFEPGGVVGMSRVAPMAMVRASMPVQSIQCAVQFERPPNTTHLDEGDESVTGNCCEAYDEHGIILMTDDNDNPSPGSMPFWSGVFAYSDTDPVSHLAGQRIKMVRRDKPTMRTPKDGRRVMVNFPDPDPATSIITKVPRQGCFDNIHTAPKLKFNPKYIRAYFSWQQF